jgi:mRNA-degrading endonuclease toxin of MazEF toxin-antitoxin module
VVIIPLSQTSPKKFPLYVSLASIGERSIAVLDQIRVVDKDRVGKKIAVADAADMEAIAEALKIVLSLE